MGAAGWRASGSGDADAFNGEAETHDPEDGGEAAEFRIAFTGERPVNLGGIQVGLLGHGLHSAEGFGELPEGDEKLCLIAVFEDAVEQFDGVGGILAKYLGHGFIARSVSDGLILCFSVVQFSVCLLVLFHQRGLLPQELLVQIFARRFELLETRLYVWGRERKILIP